MKFSSAALLVASSLSVVGGASLFDPRRDPDLQSRTYGEVHGHRWNRGPSDVAPSPTTEAPTYSPETAVAAVVAAYLASKQNSGRRKLEVAFDSDYIQDLNDECGDQNYNLFGLIEDDSTHFEMVAAPISNDDPECSRSILFDDHDTGSMLVSYADDRHLPLNWTENAFAFGNFPLSVIIDAADSAPVINPDEYDLLTNNCASFTIVMMQNLGIVIDHEMKHYAVRMMLGSAPFVEAVRSHPHADALIPNEGERLEDLSDNEVMWRLVSNYVNSFEG